MVEQVKKKLVKKGRDIKSGGRYIQYMSFEEMQKLSVPTKENQRQYIYGGGASAQIK
jgi:hypothetical protein